MWVFKDDDDGVAVEYAELKDVLESPRYRILA
jgi:hypothetical protein